MKLSIITPCSRPLNLPIIYSSILELKSKNVEWIIIYDREENYDERILNYESLIPIKLLVSKRQPSDINCGSRQRNVGIDNAIGDYLYFLDDDNLIHKFLYDKIKLYSNGNNVIIFNQFTRKMDRKLKPDFDVRNMKMGQIDTAQLIVPRKYKSRWENKRKKNEEYDYVCNLINEIGCENFKFVDKLYTFYNYIRRFDVY